jgi:hypothetical protein
VTRNLHCHFELPFVISSAADHPQVRMICGVEKPAFPLVAANSRFLDFARNDRKMVVCDR